MNPAASRPTEATNTTTAQPSELGFTTTSLDLPLEAPPHNVDTRLNEQSHFLYDQSRANNEVFSTIGIINGRPDSTERQLITFIQPPEAIPQYPHFARSPWPLAPTLGSFTTGFDVVNTPPLFNANYGALATLLPPAGSFDFANTLGLPATSSDTEYPPMMLMSSFEYTHHLVPPAGVSDVPHALMPPAGIFDTGHIFAPLAAGFSAGYTIALPGVSSVIAHTLVPLTTGFEPVLTFAPLDADFDTVSAISSRVTSSDAASASPSIAPSCSASPSIAQPPPKRHKVNLREGSEIVQSSDSETGVSNSGQNGSTIIIRDSADEDVTADQFSEFFKQFIFIRLEMIPIVYLQLVGRELAATSISPQELNRQLGNVEGFEIGAGMVSDSIGQEMLESDDPAIELILGLHRKDLLELYKGSRYGSLE
ncbi:hypothetical protein GGI17_002351 [Coemansia sp. S146]|nr:hypothetical protein GGI17_002351 [Coemansia sp. S146]